MRPYDGYSDDFDDIEGFAYDRSRSRQRLVNEARREEQREERHRNRHRSYAKDRHHLDNWDWDDDDDWDTYLDDSSFEYSEDVNRHY